MLIDNYVKFNPQFSINRILASMAIRQYVLLPELNPKIFTKFKIKPEIEEFKIKIN